MSFRSWIGFGVVAAVLVAGCSGPVGPNFEGSEDSHKERERDRDKAQFSQEDFAPSLDVLSYSLKGKFDWSSTQLAVVSEIRFKFKAPAGEKVLLNSRVLKVLGVDLEGQPVSFESDTSAGTLSFVPRTTEDEQTVRIAYEVQATSSHHRTDEFSLFAVLPRLGDPVTSRLVATFSEPTGAQQWMPCHDVTTDRALFAAEFSLDSGEMLISNGDLVKDTVIGGRRQMAYATRYTLPTYLMAFALGEFAQSSRQKGNLPLQVWHRKGLELDATGVLDALEHQMTVYEKLLVPYPFEKYALVLLPEFGGGIEHAGITFQGEVSSTRGDLSRDYGLSAHELGHQWFGDLVTVKSWDDLWIKEGMATLLAEEASRKFEDRNPSAGALRLFGSGFSPAPGDAVIDPELKPDDKYTSGPYDRAAWVLTQIRAIAGEEKFWGTLRSVLVAHAFSTISTEEFLGHWQPVLGAEVTQRLRGALFAKALPELAVNDERELVLTDSENVLLAPVDLAYAKEGTLISQALSETQSQKLEAMTGGFWVLDPKDVHPVEAFFPKAAVPAVLQDFLKPNETQRGFFVSLAPHLQWRALQSQSSWSFPEGFSEFYAALDSDSGRYEALRQYCKTVTEEQVAQAESVLAPILREPPTFALPVRGLSSALSRCPRALTGRLFGSELARLARGLSLAGGESELALVGAFSLDSATALPIWSGLLQHGKSVRARLIGATVLARHLRGSGAYEPPSPEVRASWGKVLSDALSTQSASEVGGPLLQGLAATEDPAVLPAVATFVNQCVNSTALGTAICVAADLAQGHAGAWEDFRAHVQLETLPSGARALMENPERCVGRRRVF